MATVEINGNKYFKFDVTTSNPQQLQSYMKGGYKFVKEGGRTYALKQITWGIKESGSDSRRRSKPKSILGLRTNQGIWRI